MPSNVSLVLADQSGPRVSQNRGELWVSRREQLFDRVMVQFVRLIFIFIRQGCHLGQFRTEDGQSLDQLREKLIEIGASFDLATFIS